MADAQGQRPLSPPPVDQLQATRTRSPNGSAIQDHLSQQSQQSPRVLSHGRGPLIRDSDDSDSDDIDAETGLLSRKKRRRRSSKKAAGVTCLSACCWTFLALLTAVFVAVAIAHTWIGHLVSSELKKGDHSLRSLAEGGLVLFSFDGMSIDPEPQQDADLALRVQATVGFDVRKALKWERKDDRRASWWARQEANMARWAVEKLDTASVRLNDLRVLSSAEDGKELVTIHELRDIQVPLSYPSRQGDPLIRLTQLDLHLPVAFPDPEAAAAFARAVMDKGKYNVTVEVGQAHVGAGPRGDGKSIRMIRDARFGPVSVPVTGKLPSLPAVDPASLVTLQSYSIRSCLPHPSSNSDKKKDTRVCLEGSARVTNPLTLLPSALQNLLSSCESRQRHRGLPDLEVVMPWRLPVKVSLPVPPSSKGKSVSKENKTVLLAKVETLPFRFAKGENSTIIKLEGHLVPVESPSSSEKEKEEERTVVSRALSAFVANYLAGKNNTIFAAYDASSSHDGDRQAELPPPVLGKLAGDTVANFSFPGSEKEVDLFRNVAITDMKIRLPALSSLSSVAAWASGDASEEEGDILCTGKVTGEVALPEEMAALAPMLDVTEIWPDVYVYDGEPTPRLSKREQQQQVFSAEGEDEEEVMAEEYPPHPTPLKAFARLTTLQPVPALTIHVPANSTHNATTLISATFTDAPLSILDGREGVFRGFVGKILFGGPSAKAKAGVKGVADVSAELGGWGEVNLQKLPIESSFFVGRGGVSS